MLSDLTDVNDKRAILLSLGGNISACFIDAPHTILY